MSYYLGIDGGGSNLRVALVDESLHVVHEVMTTRANPNTLGVERAAAHIQDTIRATLANHDVTVRAAGIGISGAPKAIADRWLCETVSAVLPETRVITSSDEEIALVGAHGERRGVLILAGTGSIAFGANDLGETLTIGGWGYLMNDKGSGYWLGIQALETFIRFEDGTDPRPSTLVERVRAACGFASRFDMIPWLYHPVPDSSKVAQLAALVLEEAQAGDTRAQQIIHEGAAELALLARTISRRLHITHPKIAFAGGLLTNRTPLALALMQALGMHELPVIQHSPVIGAALLAKLTVEQTST